MAERKRLKGCGFAAFAGAEIGDRNVASISVDPSASAAASSYPPLIHEWLSALSCYYSRPMRSKSGMLAFVCLFVVAGYGIPAWIAHCPDGWWREKVCTAAWHDGDVKSAATAKPYKHLKQLKDEHQTVLTGLSLVPLAGDPPGCAPASAATPTSGAAAPCASETPVADADVETDQWHHLIKEIDKAFVPDVISTSGNKRTPAPEAIQRWLAVRKELVELRAREPGFRFNGFYLNQQMWFYSWAFALLGAAIVRRGAPWWTWKSIGWGLVMGLVTRTAHILRACYPDDPERRVFSYVHLDLYPVAFYYVDHLLFWCFCTMLAALCLKWHTLGRCPDRREGRPKAPVDALNQLTRAFHEWQVDSFLLGAVFLYLALVYWRLIWKNQDVRYLVSAVLVQALWAVAWAFASFPLKKAWTDWQAVRSRELKAIWRSITDPGEASASASERLEFLQKLCASGKRA
jgi:hypothetical protein